MTVLEFSLHGATLRLETGYTALDAYAAAFLASLPDAAGNSPDISVRFYWNQGEIPGLPGGEWQVLGRRVALAGDWSLLREVPPVPGLQAAARWQEGRLELALAYRPVSLRQLLRNRLAGERERLFAALCYYQVIFPLVFYLEQRRGWQLAHLAAVEHPAGNILLTGLPGAGKSTLALSLLANPEARLLSDNLALLGDGRVYTLPEPVHLDQRSHALISPQAAEALKPLGGQFSHGREVYLLEGERRAWELEPEALFFLGFDAAASCRRLDAQETARRMAAINSTAREISAFQQFSLPLALAGAGVLPEPEALQIPAPGYELWMRRGAPLAEAQKVIAAVLSKAPAAQQPADVFTGGGI